MPEELTESVAQVSAAEKAEPQYVFFVYIVESPSAPDLYHGRSEGGLVASALSLDQIPSVTRIAITREAFEAALQIGLPEAMKRFEGRYPILHLSAHGSNEGIQLSNGEVVSWNEFRELLIPINESLGGALLLCMSACKGYSACQMAMQPQDDAKHPYFAMVGNYSQPTWSDTAVSYLAFYHLLAKGKSIPEGVVAMNAASGESSWVAEAAEATRQGYIKYLEASSEPLEAQRELEAVADNSALSPDAKALELRRGG